MKRSVRVNKEGLRPCRKCGEKTELQIHDCGYSSFNIGHVRCVTCGYKLTVNDADYMSDYVKAWNKDEPTELERLRDENKFYRTVLRRIVKQDYISGRAGRVARAALRGRVAQ